ncbi:hypothetical protein AAES_13507 [Amazona aestiva]|uniref:Uncharacterized protein n=1 Tax=Amazona aestiva TaxID=12930 RepID=A0A0Q3XB95_AMAAE|nr:hypothetical protein AAES_13507 [Amazona aestiva]
MRVRTEAERGEHGHNIAHDARGACEPEQSREKASSSSGRKMQLLENEFSRTIRELIELHLLRQDSIPAFLSALTLDLFSRQTIA